MGRKLSLIKNLFLHPLLFKTILSTLKSSQLLMNAGVANQFRELVNPLLNQEKPQNIQEFARAHEYVNEELLVELFKILEAENYINIMNNEFEVLKLIPDDVIKQVEIKINEDIRKSFMNFIPTVMKAMDDRLKGVPLSEFDAGELRVQWEIALKGDFYTIQREKAFNFARFPDFIKEREAPIRLLDYGCGSGEGTRQFYNFIEKKCDVEFTIDGCDVSIGLLEIAEDDIGLEYPLEFFSLKDRPLKDNYYDAIFLSQVIHWDKDPFRLIKELKASLKPGGMLFGVESNYTKRVYQIDLFLRLLGAQGFPTKELLHDWFESNGLDLKFDDLFYSFKAVKPP